MSKCSLFARITTGVVVGEIMFIKLMDEFDKKD